MDASGAAAQLTESEDSDFNGYRNLGIGDQDGDGLDDVMVTAVGDKVGTGKVYIILGPVSGTSTTAAASVATISGDSAYEYLGWQPSSGDVNGDGTADLVLGAPSMDVVGASFVFLGPVTTGTLSPSDADATITGDAADGQWTGGCNSAAGDVDGDGVDDLLVSADQTDDGATDNGVAWFFYGPVSGAHDASDADVRVYGSTADNANLGWYGSIGGDLDGDGLDDVAVTAPGAEEGFTYVFDATTVDKASEVDVAAADASIVGEAVGDYFGLALDTRGDLDGDGKDELAVSAISTTDGTVYVFYGPTSGTIGAASADFIVEAIGPESLGNALGFVGDLDADGLDDLAVGATSHSTTSTEGAVTIWYGRH
jgi:hypothetical protein